MKRKLQLTLLALSVSALAIAAIAQAEIAQKGDVRVSFDGQLTPRALPRSKEAPVTVSVAAKISSTNPKKAAPQLTKMAIAINSNGHLNTTGLPICELDDIQPSTTADALAVCKKSLVGEGSFTANVPLSGRAPFPSSGKLYAFNGKENGRPAILAHVYGVRPAPTSFTLVFVISQAKGKFGTTLTVELPKSNSEGYITGISLDLGKTFSYHGKQQNYLSASCPAPKGVNVAGFPFAKASFSFTGAPTLSSTLNRSCKALG